MSRFYVSPEKVHGNKIAISGPEAHHILDVMRLKVADKVTVFDGTGREYVGFIKEAKSKSLTVEIVKTKEPQGSASPQITLAQAIPKKGKMDYIVEKATELGVDSIIPMVTARTVVELEEEKAKTRVERWKKISIEAAKQCGRMDVPEIKEVAEFFHVLSDVSDYDLALLCCLNEETAPLREFLGSFEGGKIIIFIGPEGDFTPEEIEIAKRVHCRLLGLGERILRSDTAPVVALSILNYELTR
jgi:16S rRNA (uracil1498-N3)-methyltransferase